LPKSGSLVFLATVGLETSQTTFGKQWTVIVTALNAGNTHAIKGGGYVVAPAAGGFLAQQYGFPMIFVISAAVGVIAFVLSLFLPADRGGTIVDDDEELSFRDALLVFTDGRLLPICRLRSDHVAPDRWARAITGVPHEGMVSGRVRI
jgi:MFS family permease